MHVTRHPTHGGPTHTPQHKQPIPSSPAHQPAIIFGHKISLSSFLFQLPMDFLKDSAIESPKYPRLDKARVQDRDLAGARHVSPAAPSDDRHVPHDGGSHGQPGREPVWRAQQADRSCQPSPCSVTIKEPHRVRRILTGGSAITEMEREGYQEQMTSHLGPPPQLGCGDRGEENPGANKQPAGR